MNKYTTMKVNELICETLHPQNIIAKFFKKMIKNKIVESL
jgi:hypothetical protein